MALAEHLNPFLVQQRRLVIPAKTPNLGFASQASSRVAQGNDGHSLVLPKEGRQH